MFQNVNRVMGVIDHAIDRVSALFCTLSGAMIVLMAFASAYGVIRRYLLGSPEPYSYEISMIFLLWASIMGMPALESQDGQIRVDFISMRFRLKAQNILLQIFVPLLGLFVVCLLTWSSWQDALITRRFGEVSPSPWGEPLFPIKVMVPITYALLGFVLLSKLYKGIANLKTE